MSPEAVVVTGSRLRSTLGGAPTFVLTREQIKQRGLGSVEEIVRSLPQNLSEVNAAAASDNSINSVDAQGQSMVNLRGFGESSTLVLVNGRRWPQASSFGSGAVNLNGVPFSAIERVEVLTDGASAIYGAEAQAGVINFILRKDWQGGETMVRYDWETDRWGEFSVGADGTFTGLLEDVAVPGAEPTVLNGTPGGPERWKVNGYLNWMRGGVSLTLSAHYSSSYANFSYSPQGRVDNYRRSRCPRSSRACISAHLPGRCAARL